MTLQDDDRPAKKTAHEIGSDLSLLSVAELSARLALLHAEIERLVAAAQLLHGPPVSEQQVVRRQHPVADVHPARRVDAGSVGEER